MGNCLFYFISYLLDDHLSIRQNNMTHLNQSLLVNIKKHWYLSIYKGQFTLGIKYQNTLCFNV